MFRNFWVLFNLHCYFLNPNTSELFWFEKRCYIQNNRSTFKKIQRITMNHPKPTLRIKERNLKKRLVAYNHGETKKQKWKKRKLGHLFNLHTKMAMPVAEIITLQQKIIMKNKKQNRKIKHKQQKVRGKTNWR